MVLLILMFMGGIALILIGKLSIQKYEITLEEYEEFDSIETAQLVTSLYEIRCAKQGFEDGCIDIHKALAFSLSTDISTPALRSQNEVIHDHYYDIFYNAKIEVKEIYPWRRNITLYEHNASNPDVNGRITQSTELIRIPVSLYNSSQDIHSFATLEVSQLLVSGLATVEP